MGDGLLGLGQAPADGEDGLPAPALGVQDLLGDDLDVAPLLGGQHSGQIKHCWPPPRAPAAPPPRYGNPGWPS